MTQEPRMKPTSHTNMKKSAVCRFAFSLVAVAGLAAAQDQTPHAWRSVNDPLPATLDQAPDQSAPSPNINAQPDQSQGGNQQFDPAQSPGGPGPAAQQNYPPQNYPPQNYPPPPNNYGPPPTPVPARLTIKQGTYVTVRI